MAKYLVFLLLSVSLLAQNKGGGVRSFNGIAGNITVPRLYSSQITGLVTGSGQTLAVRQSNATLLQAAITLCDTNGIQLVMAPGIYEIDSATGLTVSQTNYDSGFDMEGSRAVRIIQFHANAPVLTVGDITGGSDYSINVTIHGLRLEYGVSQTGNTGANTLQIGALRSSNISNIWLGSDGGAYVAPATPYQFPAYRAFYMVAGSDQEFSNTFDDFFIEGAQFRLADMSSLGTGSVFNDWYMTNGYAGQPGQISDCGWFMANGDGIFSEINVESVAANAIINGQTLRGDIFSSIHLESVQLTGFNPMIWEGGTNRITLNSFEASGLFISSTTLNGMSASGTASVFGTYGDDALTVNNLNIQLQNAGDVVNMPLQIFNTENVGDTQPSIEANNIAIDDFVSGGLVGETNLDPNTPLVSYAGATRYSHYSWGNGVSKVDKATRPVSATYTVWGQDQDPTIQVPASITSFTLTLADKLTGSGAGASTAPKVGNRVHVRRLSGAAAGTLTVADAGTGTLTTNTVSGTDLYFAFNGTAYVTVP